MHELAVDKIYLKNGMDVVVVEVFHSCSLRVNLATRLRERSNELVASASREATT